MSKFKSVDKTRIHKAINEVDLTTFDFRDMDYAFSPYVEFQSPYLLLGELNRLVNHPDIKDVKIEFEMSETPFVIKIYGKSD